MTNASRSHSMLLCVSQVLHRASTRIHIVKSSIGAVRSSRGYTTSESQESILTALRRTKTLLPKILSSSKASSWNKLIETSSDILAGAISRKPRIAVWGSDEHSQSIELVSALLDNPLVSDRRIIDALRDRRRGNTDGVFTICHGDFDVSSSNLTLDLSWLRELDVEMIEIPARHSKFKTLLYNADVQLIVTSPLCAPLSRGLESLLLSPTSYLIFPHHQLDQRAVDLALSRLAACSSAPLDVLKTKVLRVCPLRALSALDVFREAPNSLAAIQVFQNDFLDSGVVALSESISRTLSLDREAIKSRHAQLVFFGALEECRNFVEDASNDIAVTQMRIDEIHTRVDEVSSSSIRDILGGKKAPVITEAMNKATREMEVVIDGLKWWKLPFKVDDLGNTLSRTAERVWCPDIEAQLQFQAGRLSVFRSLLTAETHESLRLIPSCFRSAVLLNTLHQISTRPPDLSPTTFSHPLEYRLQQLEYAILSLHLRAQRIVLGAIITVFLSTGSMYSAWMLGWVTGPTAVGTGALGVVVGVRWLVENWEKGKKRWWEDWRRVGEGLGRDLGEMLATVMQEQVAAVPVTAAEELSKTVSSRLNDIKELRGTLEKLESSSPLYSQQRASPK